MLQPRHRQAREMLTAQPRAEWRGPAADVAVKGCDATAAYH
jgi:hypothetical protein